jgi:hypothetical protein
MPKQNKNCFMQLNSIKYLMNFVSMLRWRSKIETRINLNKKNIKNIKLTKLKKLKTYRIFLNRKKKACCSSTTPLAEVAYQPSQ